MLDEELEKLGKNIETEDFIKLEYYYKKNYFFNNFSSYMNSGKFTKLIELYYTSREKLFLYLEEKKKEVEFILEKNNISLDIDLEEIAMKIFNQVYDNDEEFFKYNMLAYKIALDESIKDFESFSQGDYYYLANQVEVILNFIKKLLFDFKILYERTCFRRTEVLPSTELFSIFEEDIRGYTTNDFAKAPLKIIVLRQIIEVKIKRSLGFINILNIENNTEVIVNISDFFEYIKKKEKQNKIKLPVKLDILIAMNKASNRYIHTGEFSNFFSWHEKIAQILLREFCFKRYPETTNIEASFLMTKSLADTLEQDLQNFFEEKGKRIKKFSGAIKINLKHLEITVVDKIE